MSFAPNSNEHLCLPCSTLGVPQEETHRPFEEKFGELKPLTSLGSSPILSTLTVLSHHKLKAKVYGVRVTNA